MRATELAVGLAALVVLGSWWLYIATEPGIGWGPRLLALLGVLAVLALMFAVAVAFAQEVRWGRSGL